MSLRSGTRPRAHMGTRPVKGSQVLQGTKAYCNGPEPAPDAVSRGADMGRVVVAGWGSMGAHITSETSAILQHCNTKICSTPLERALGYARAGASIVPNRHRRPRTRAVTLQSVPRGTKHRGGQQDKVLRHKTSLATLLYPAHVPCNSMWRPRNNPVASAPQAWRQRNIGMALAACNRHANAPAGTIFADEWQQTSGIARPTSGIDTDKWPWYTGICRGSRPDHIANSEGHMSTKTTQRHRYARVERRIRRQMERKGPKASYRGAK